MTRNLCTPISTTGINSDGESLKQWVDEQAKNYNLSFLLAHAEDGVIWGHFNEGSLLTSGEVFENLPILRSLTLQQCRIFGKMGEVLLWKTEAGWHSRICREEENTSIDFIEENQILWGTCPGLKNGASERDGFTLLADGSQGLRHAVPLVDIPFSDKKDNVSRPVRLKVRQYITYYEDGLANIFLSRLVNLFPKG